MNLYSILSEIGRELLDIAYFDNNVGGCEPGIRMASIIHVGTGFFVLGLVGAALDAWVSLICDVTWK